MNYELVLETQRLGRTFSGERCDGRGGEWGQWREMMIHSVSE